MARRGFHLVCCLTLAALTWLASAGVARADWLGFRNDLPFPVVVQSLRPDLTQPKMNPLMLLYPGEVRWDWVGDTRTRVVTVHQARPPRSPLVRVEIEPAAKEDELYAVQSNGQGVQLVKQPKAKR